MENSEDEVPPLEDMSEYFKSTQSGSSTSKPAKVKTDSSLLQLESDMPPLHSDLLIVKDKETKQVPSQPVPSSGSGGHSGSGNFGGMKKGFLGAPSNKKSKTSATPSQGKGLSKSQEPSKGKMPYLKGNTKSSEKNLKFDEVQDEMNKSVPLLSSKEWVTDDLLGQVDRNPILSRGFRDPNLTRVLEEFHKNPQEAFKTAQNNSQAREFLQEFCKVMGTHFTSLADQKEMNQKEELITEHLSEEDQRMKDALTKPEVQAVLQDTEIQQLIELLKDNAEEAQRFLESNKNGQFHAKVRLLVEYGVLNVQRK